MSKDAPAGASIEEMVEAMFRLIRAENPGLLVTAAEIQIRLAIIGYLYTCKQVRDALFRLRTPENIYHHYLNKYGYGKWVGLHDNPGFVPPVSVESMDGNKGV